MACAESAEATWNKAMDAKEETINVYAARQLEQQQRLTKQQKDIGQQQQEEIAELRKQSRQ